MQHKKIVIAGGTGFIGQEMIAHFGDRNDLVILTRHPQRNSGRTRYVYWNAETLHGWETHLEGADLLINLAGKSVNCRYNARNRKEIFNSRTNATAVLGQAILTLAHPPRLWVNAASATIYRHAEDRPMDEYSGEIENDFSVQVCKRWEQTFNDFTLPHTRKVILRIAITLGARGGVMVPYLNLAKYGLGGHQGHGRQMFSWVHVTDLCRMIAWLYGQPQLDGTFNCSAPHPVSNRTFMRTLRKVSGHTFGLPAPAWLLALGARMIGTETELLLKSRWVLPTRITQAGFTFRYPYLREALEDISSKMQEKITYLHAIMETAPNGNKKLTVVLGASANPQRYSFLAVSRLKTHGHPVVAIGKRAAQIADTPVIQEHPALDNVDTVTLYLNPQRQREYYDYILQLRPKRLIFNPGTENNELQQLALQHGIQPIAACTLVMLSTGQY